MAWNNIIPFFISSEGYKFIKYKSNPRLDPEDVNPKLKTLYAFKEIPVIYILDLLDKFHFQFLKENDEKRFLLEYINQRKQSELAKWEVIIDSKSIISKNECLNIAGFEIMPTKRAATYEENNLTLEIIKGSQTIYSMVLKPVSYY